MSFDDYRLLGVRLPDPGEVPLSWEEVLVWLRIKEEGLTVLLQQGKQV